MLCCVAPLLAGLPQSVEMLVTLQDTAFTAGTALQLTCTEGLSLSGDAVSDSGTLTLTDADSDTRELRVILSAFVMLTDDTCDSSLCHEVTLPACCLMTLNAGVPVVLKFLIFLKFQNCSEILAI